MTLPAVIAAYLVLQFNFTLQILFGPDINEVGCVARFPRSQSPRRGLAAQCTRPRRGLLRTRTQSPRRSLQTRRRCQPKPRNRRFDTTGGGRSVPDSSTAKTVSKGWLQWHTHTLFSTLFGIQAVFERLALLPL